MSSIRPRTSRTRNLSILGGLVGAASLNFCEPGLTGCDSTTTAEAGAAYNLNQFADRAEADFIRIP
jgi:hypothetical protein